MTVHEVNTPAVQRIMSSYSQLLMLDNDDDSEKRWIVARQPLAGGLSTLQFHIVSYLAAHPGTTAKGISKGLGVLPGTLSKRLAALTRRGLVLVESDDRDARCKHYTLTERGKSVAATHEDLLTLKTMHFSQRLIDFSPSELQTIQRFLTAFIDEEGKGYEEDADVNKGRL